MAEYRFQGHGARLVALGCRDPGRGRCGDGRACVVVAPKSGTDGERGDHEADETIEVILEGSMPPYSYTLFGLHPEANLSRDEIAELVAGLRATPGLAENDRDDEDQEDQRDEEDEEDRGDDEDE